MKIECPLPRSFFEDELPTVAKELLGKVLVRQIGEVLLSGIIVETEAYLAEGDPAAHNFIGKTARNVVLFGEAGHAYVHRMRQYCLMDIVTEGVEVPGSVLIRAIEPVKGVEEMKRFRRTDDMLRLANGPGKVCQALAIDMAFNGLDITSEDSDLFIADLSAKLAAEQIGVSRRIGISTGTDALLRFFLKGSPYVSR